MSTDTDTGRQWRKIDIEGVPVWQSDDGCAIDGSAGRWYPTLGHTSLYECATPEAAMELADQQWPAGSADPNAVPEGHSD